MTEKELRVLVLETAATILLEASDRGHFFEALPEDATNADEKIVGRLSNELVRSMYIRCAKAEERLEKSYTKE